MGVVARQCSRGRTQRRTDPGPSSHFAYSFRKQPVSRLDLFMQRDEGEANTYPIKGLIQSHVSGIEH